MGFFGPERTRWSRSRHFPVQFCSEFQTCPRRRVPQMACGMPSSTETVIIGNGPSALILSYILHGHIPIYDETNPHPDPILHQKLLSTRDLLNLDVDSLTEHFAASRFSYSTQALPINVLLDTLVRPWGEIDDTNKRTCVKWQYQPDRAVAHVVLGNTTTTGGQWVDNPVQASWDIGTLSYGGMLSLPGYSIQDHFERTLGQHMRPFSRPTRRQVTGYLAAYPAAVGIENSIYNGQVVSKITRAQSGFFIGSHEISCKYLVLASGIFTQLIPARPLLQPLFTLPDPPKTQGPLLVVGSGFSAADIIISTPRNQKIVHIFKWQPQSHPSPLRACNHEVYPEYVEVYRKMKMAALASSPKSARPRVRRMSSSLGEHNAELDARYEGLPNTAIVDVRLDEDTAIVTLQHGREPVFERRVNSMAYVVGRRGSLSFLQPSLLKDVCWPIEEDALISGQTLREKVIDSTEVAKNVFVIGSLTGDSLIRFAYGGCTFAAGKIMADDSTSDEDSECGRCSTKTSQTASPYMWALNGLDGHNSSPVRVSNGGGFSSLDRRKDNANEDVPVYAT